MTIGVMKVDNRALEKAFLAWGDAHVHEEISQSNRASRTWNIAVAGRPAVAKLTFDRAEYVEPGLRVAEHVFNRTTVQTGAPLRTVAGGLAVPWESGPNSSWTLSVLQLVEGDPLDVFDGPTAREAGELLARIHLCLGLDDAPPVPAHLLEWFRSFAHERGDTTIEAVLDEVDAISASLTFGVVYGDPSPELLREHDGRLALIDWGTPSFGPLMYDVATWAEHIARNSDPSDGAGPAFVDEYCSRVPWAAERESLRLFSELWRWLVSVS